MLKTQPDEGLQDALSRFVDPRGRTDIKFGLDRIKRALESLGNPQNQIAPAVHIAGTNGKGSTAAFLRHMAEAAGYTAHVFTSPHLVRVNERIRIAGRLVEDHELVEALERIETTDVDLTYFEALTAATFLLFSQVSSDLCIIETGAGGELDSTNVMDKPAACVITTIARDHEAMFGVKGLLNIARVKAGIMRKGVPVIIAHQPQRVQDVLLEEAEKRGAIPLLADREWTAKWRKGAFVYSDQAGDIHTPWLGLAGGFQRRNAGAACAAFKTLELEADPAMLAAGLREARWSGRLQELRPGPITRGAEASVIIDGAHNTDAARHLAAAIKQRFDGVEEKPCIIVAMQANKNAQKILKHLSLVADLVIACPLPSDHGQEGGSGVSPKDMVKIVRKLGGHALAATSIQDALMLATAAGAKTIYACGSLYLAGALLELNEEAPD